MSIVKKYQVKSVDNTIIEEKVSVVEQSTVVDTPILGETMVYIAPEGGSKYYYKYDCSGLKNANSIIQVPIEEALA